MYCSNCQNEIPADSSFCPYCGAKQQSSEELSSTPVTDLPQATTRTKRKPVALIIAAVVILIALAAVAFNYMQQKPVKSTEPLTPCSLRLDMNRKQVESIMKIEPAKVNTEKGKTDVFYEIDYSSRPAKFDTKNDWGNHVDYAYAIVSYKTSSENSNIDSIHFNVKIDDYSTERAAVMSEFVDYCSSVLDDFDSDIEDEHYCFYWFDEPFVAFDIELLDDGVRGMVSVYNES